MKCPNCTNFNGFYKNCDEAIFVIGQQNNCIYYNPIDDDKDDTFYGGTYHCPRCDTPVLEWGLCEECAKLY